MKDSPSSWEILYVSQHPQTKEKSIGIRITGDHSDSIRFAVMLDDILGESLKHIREKIGITPEEITQAIQDWENLNTVI